jgi:hypothetical protein
VPQRHRQADPIAGDVGPVTPPVGRRQVQLAGVHEQVVLIGYHRHEVVGIAHNPHHPQIGHGPLRRDRPALAGRPQLLQREGAHSIAAAHAQVAAHGQLLVDGRLLRPALVGQPTGDHDRTAERHAAARVQRHHTELAVPAAGVGRIRACQDECPHRRPRHPDHLPHLGQGSHPAPRPGQVVGRVVSQNGNVGVHRPVGGKETRQRRL